MFGVAREINCSSENKTRPVARLLPEANAQDLKLIGFIESACGIASGGTRLLSFDFKRDDLPAFSISFTAHFAAFADILAFG